jgi:phenylalanyl-tRNA synthetase alpha chain
VTEPSAPQPPDIPAFLASLTVFGGEELRAAGTLDDLRAAEAAVLGKRSPLARLNTRLGALTPDERRQAGAAINATRQELSALAAARRTDLEAAARRERLEVDRLDLTEVAESRGLVEKQGLDGAGRSGVADHGHLHLVTQTRDLLEDIFTGMGFAVAEGPEAETDWYNFEALNLPRDHPARSLWDTLYLDLGAPETILLRTHTSPVQIHLMENQAPPIYAVMPGRVYRKETTDARHLPVFHQIEALVVDRGISFADLAGTIEAFTAALFGPKMHSRLRPSYFPFTEPSAEFDVTCPICAGAGCRTCSGSGWIELGGCGMVDPNVFAAVDIDPEVWTGFAFGFGIDRLAMIRTELGDIRALLENDLRFLTQF